jgi:hypothetical protein
MEFRTTNGVTSVSSAKRTSPPRSAAQQQQAQRFGEAVQAWRTAGVTVRDAWRTASTGTGMNGYQLFLSEYQGQGISAPALPVIP